MPDGDAAFAARARAIVADGQARRACRRPCGRRNTESPVIAPDGADDVAGLTGRDLGAFHQRQLATGRGAQQRLEVGAGMVRVCSSRASLGKPVGEPAPGADPFERLAGREVEPMAATSLGLRLRGSAVDC